MERQMEHSAQEMAQRIQEIREKMALAAQKAGRRPQEVLLCAASKMQEAETVRTASALNIDLFGENRVQELVEKLQHSAYGEKPVHFIGHL